MRSDDLWPHDAVEFTFQTIDGIPTVVVSAHDGGIGKARWMFRIGDFLRFAAATNEFTAQQLRELALIAGPR